MSTLDRPTAAATSRRPVAERDLVPCPVCGAATCDRGPTVHGSRPAVAGVPIDLGAHAARLRHCRACEVLFKHPFVPDPLLMDCYRASPGDNWEHAPDPQKRRFDEIADLVRDHAPAGRILDVGCSNGALPAYLAARGTAGAEHLGLEPSAAAAAEAERRGVRILGGTFDDLAEDERFDAILAIDVLEHLTDPPTFFAAVRRHLARGGVFIALTGDHAAWSWRLQGAAYWYAALPEHQVFYTRRTVQHLADAHRLSLHAFRRTSHARQRRFRTVRDAVRGTVFGLLRRVRLTGTRPAPGWLPARDHMLVVFDRTP